MSSGNQRHYLGAVPEAPEGAMRLVILFCGASESASEMELRGFNEYLGNSTIVVYPEPYYFMGAFYEDSLTNDFQMVEDLVEHIGGMYPIDLQDVCAGGFSSGGEFTYDLACEFNDPTSMRPFRFQSIAVVSGWMDESEATLDHCPVVGDLPVLAIHGTQDNFVEYDGVTIFDWGTGPDTVITSPTEQTIQFWAETVNGCEAEPVVTELPDLVVEDQNPSTVERLEYNCPGCNTHLYRIIDGFHTWPTSDAAWDNMYGGHNEDIVASEVIADFFDCSAIPNAVQQMDEPAMVTVYPNPAADFVVIESNREVLQIDIFTKEGRRIRSFNFSHQEVPLDDLSPGIYFVRVALDRGVVVKKVFKQ